MRKIERLGVSALDKPLSDEQTLRAIDAVRVFAKSDGMVAVQKQLEDYRKRCTSVLHKSASNVVPASYAEAAGAMQSIEKFYEIFDSILREADRFNNE